MTMESTRRSILRTVGAGIVSAIGLASTASAGKPQDSGGGDGDDSTDPVIDSLTVSVNDTDNSISFDYEVSDNFGLEGVGVFIYKDGSKKIVEEEKQSESGTSATGTLTTDSLAEKSYDWAFYVEDTSNNRTYQNGESTVN